MNLTADVSVENIQNLITSGAGLTVLLAYYVILVIAMWKMFMKAGYPGILAIIPIVNWFILVKIAGYTAWAGLLALIPLVNVVFAIVVAVRVGRGFGHGGVFSFFLLWLFAPIGYFIVGLSRDRYTKPV